MKAGELKLGCRFPAFITITARTAAKQDLSNVAKALGTLWYVKTCVGIGDGKKHSLF